nr:hypothetical protein 1 (Tetx 5' region) - Bacteroides fragilis [Bacteroides fragilis]
MYFSRPWTSI